MSAFQAFPEREAILTGGSRTPARVVAAHLGLVTPVKTLHSVALGGLDQPIAGQVFYRDRELTRWNVGTNGNEALLTQVIFLAKTQRRQISRFPSRNVSPGMGDPLENLDGLAKKGPSHLG